MMIPRMSLFLIVFFLVALSNSGAFCGEVQDAGKAAQEALKEVAPLGLPDTWDLLIRGRKAKAAAQQAEEALRKAVAAREKATQYKDSEAEGIADKAIEIAKAALSRARDDLMRVQGLSFLAKRLRDAFGGQISAEADAELESRYGFLKDPALEKRLTSIIDRLKRVSLRPTDPLKVRILNTDRITTIAAASATTVYFDKAYLDRHPSDDELMFVTGHELAHSELDHSVQFVVKDKLQLKLEDLEGLDRFNARDPRAFAAIREAAHAVVMGEYSREQELQADLLGAQVALNGGGSAKGIKKTLDWLKQREQIREAHLDPAQKKLESITADHPTAQERLGWLEKALGEKFWEKQ